MPPTSGLRPRSLLAYLLLHPGPHPRARLAGRFWPDVLDTSARASLRSALWAVREALERVGGGAYLAADRTHVGIAGDLPRSVDAEEFDRLAALGRPRPRSRRPSPSPARRCWRTWPTSGRSRRRTPTATGWSTALERLAAARRGARGTFPPRSGGRARPSSTTGCARRPTAT